MASKQSTGSSKFTVKQRQDLGLHLTKLDKDQQHDICKKAVDEVKKSLHTRTYVERLRALEDSKGEAALLNCVDAMCSNFVSYYATFLPRKRYSHFQQAWFAHMGQYIDGSVGVGCPSNDVVARTRSGRMVKDNGAQHRVEANQCKKLWDQFVRSIGTPLSEENQRILVSSLAHAVYDLMTQEVKEFKESLLPTTDDQAPLEPLPEDEDIIHRYLGFSLKSLIEQKKQQQQKLFKDKRREELELLQGLIAKDDKELLPETVTHLSQGGLTCVSPKMLKFGGDLLMELAKQTGRHFNKDIDTLQLSNDVIENDTLKTVFRNCIANISETVASEVLDTVYSEISMKIINARVNEMLRAKQEVDLEKEGKVVNNTQSLRDTLKTYCINRQRH